MVWRKRTRQRRIDHTLATELELRQNTAVGIDHAGNAGIGNPHEREPLLDRAQPRTREMLVRAGGKSARVVRDV